MKSSPLVSVIIPCYNYGRFLSEAINSVLRQDYDNIEIIVVDDGSTDDTKKIALGFGEKISYHHQSNSGLPASRNLGIENMHGDYAVFLDADDTLEPDFVTSCLQALAEHPETAFVYTQLRYFGRSSGVSHYPAYNLKSLIYGNYINASVMIRAEIIKKFQYDPTLRVGWEDYDLYLTLAEHGHHGLLLDRPLLNYRKHDSMVDKIDLAREKAMLLMMMDRHKALIKPWSKTAVGLQYYVRANPLLAKPARALKHLGRRHAG